MAKAELEDMGEDTDTMVSSTAKLRENIQGMTGFDIMADEAGTEFKDIYDIVIGIGKEWDKLSDINRAALLEQLAGKNQANALASALQNWQTIEKAYQTSVGASDVNGGVGSAMTELENAQQGIEYSLGRFKATFQEFAHDLIDTSIVKGIVDFGSTTVGVFDTLIKKAGSLGTVIATLAAAKGIGALTSEYKKLKDVADAGGSVWKQLGTDIAAPIKSLVGSLGGAGAIGLGSAVAGIAAVIIRLQAMAAEADKAKKAMTASVSEYNTESGTLDSLNQELTETQNKILALQALENPSLVDQQELADLQQRNSELERAIQLQEQLVKTAAMQAASDAEDTLKKWTSDANFLWGRTDNAFDPDKIAAARENYASDLAYFIPGEIVDEADLYKSKARYADPKTFKDDINELIALYQECDEEITNTQAAMDATDIETKEGLNTYQNLSDYLTTMNKKMVETEGYISTYRDTLRSVWDAYDTEMNEGIYNRHHREQMAQIEQMLDAIGETVQKGQDLNSVQDAIDNIFNQSDFLETKNRLVEAAKEGREALTKELASIGESSPLGQAIKDAFIQDGELEDYFMNMIDPAKLNLDEVRKQLADFITGFDEDPITQQGRKQLYNSLIGTASDEQIQEFYNALVNRGELANIGSMSAEEFTRAFNETVTQQEPVSNGTFADLLTKDDSEVLQTVSSFREQMSGLSEVTNQLQSGEVTMSDVIEKFPELAGRTTTLADSISDLKTENLLKFKSNWDELTKGLAGEELENANKQFTEFLKDVDMSGVKFDRAGKTILDALFPDAEASSAERKALVEAWNGAYDDVVKTTADEELLMKIIADPANAYKTKDEIIAAFESAKVTMDVETTWNGDMSGIDAYNAAKETANAGDKYLQMLSIAKEVQEMADKGLVGTDEFKAGAALFSPNAMGDVENWAENSGKVFRYLTEDKEGVTNLLKDMAQLTNENGTAMATWNEETGDYTLNIQDFEKSADALGISFDLFTASLARLGDYGGNLDFFASMEEGQDHLADLYGDLAKQEVKLQELKEAQAAGDKTVTDTVINEQQKRVDQIRQSIENTQSLLDVFIDKSAEKLEAETKSHAQSALSLIDSLGGMDTRTQQRALQALQTESDQYSLGLKFEVDENGMLSLVESSVQDLQDYVDGKPVKPKVEIEEPIEEATADENEVHITTDLDRSEYDSFVEEVEGTVLKAKIETVTGATGIEDKKHGHEVTQETAERRKKFAQPDGAIGIDDKQHGHDVSQATAQAAKAHRLEYTKQWLGDITSDANEAINKVIWDARTNFNKTLKSRGDFLERSTWSNSDKIKGIIADINNDIAQKRAEALTVQNQKELDELLSGQKIESTEMENELYRRENPVRNAAEKTYDAVQESVASAVEKTGEGIANEQYVSRPDQTLVGFGATGTEPTRQETPLDPMLEAGMAMNEVLEQGALRATELYRAVNEGEVYGKVATNARKAADEVNATNDAMAETERQVGTTAPEDTEYDPSEAMADEAEYVERINASRQEGIKNIKEEAQEVHGLLGLAQQLAAEEEARNQAAQTEAIYQPPNFYRKSFVPNKGIEAFVEDLRVAGKEAEDLSGVDLDFDVNTASIEELEGVISQLNAVKESLSSQGLENPGLEQFIFAMNNLRNFRLDVTAQTEPIDALKARIDEIASSDTTVDVVAEVQNDEQVQVLAEHLASLPTDIQTSIGISTENVGNVQGIISQATQNPQSISVPVEYTQGTIQSPEAQTTDVNYERGSQEPPKDEDATVSYTYGGQDPPHDATATVNYTMGAYETVLPPATQVVQRVYIDSGGGMRGGRAEGTAHAYAGGTLYGLWEEYRHSQNAYAFGSRKDWALPQDEEALVNEVGTESVVRNGKWFEIPGGAHVEQLKRGDIIFSAAQTAELKKYGKVYSGGGHGRVARATGTAYNMINAHAVPWGAGIVGDKKPFEKLFDNVKNFAQTAISTASNAIKSSATQKGYGNLGGYSGGGGGTSSGGGGGSSGGGSGGSSGGSGSSGKSKGGSGGSSGGGKALDKFKEWFEKLFDWIEVRIDRVAKQIDNFSQKADNAVGYIDKNLNLNSAMKLTGTGNEDYKLKTTTDTDGVQRVSGLTFTGSKRGTQMDNNLRGAQRYFEQAEKVRKQAVKNKLVKDSQASEIIGRIQSGTIDISEYDEKQREFISSYQEWYDKAMDCVYAVDELKASMKELQQQKLDNIVDDYEALASISEAVSSRSEAIVDYYTASGRVVNSKEAKQHMGTQRDEASKLVQVYLDEANAYADELKKAKTVFGEASVEYREAEAQYQEIYKSLIEAQTQVKDLDRAIFELDLTKLEYATERLRQFSEKLTAMFSLKQTRGTLFGQPGSVITESDYTSQASANNDVIKMLYADREKRIQEIAQFEDEVDSEKYKELADAIAKDEQEIYKLLESNEELKASIRELRWKPFHDLQEELNQTVEDFDHLRSLIKDRQMFDENDGTQITARGYANLAMIAQQMVVARRQMADYREALNKLNEDYKNNNISLETYNEESREYVKIIQNAATATQGYRSAILDMYKTQIQNENEALQSSIKLRSEALDKKRQYYEYDKKLRGQSKDIAQLRATANALAGVTNDAGLAELAKIRAELAEKEAEREDTIRNHSYELQRDGYSQLSQDATETLNNTLTAIEANAQKEEAVVTNMLMRLVETYNTSYGDIATNVSTQTAAIAENVGLSTQNTVASIQEGTAAQQEAISLSYEGMLDAIETNYELAYGAINEVITTSGTTVNDTTQAAIEDINTSIFTILEGTGSVDTSIINTGNTITSTINTSVGHAKSTLMSLGTEITNTFDGVAVSIAKALETAKIELGYGDAGKQGTVANIEQQLKQDTEKKIADAKAAKLASEKKTEPAKKDPITPASQPAKTATPAQPAKKAEPAKGGTFTVKPAKTSYTYTGKAIKPGVTVTANGKAVGAGSYSVTYSNNVKVGTATIKVTGKGNYAGWSGSCTFSITAAKKKKSGGDGKARVGDKVTYASGVYHGDSYGGGASGYMYRGQKVYITKINSGSSYPYHISTGSSLGSGDLGWVKLSQLKGYRTGTLGTKKNELNWTHEGEIIRTSDGGMLRQLSAGTQVIPKELSANLMKWGEYDPAKLFSGNGSSVNAAVVQPVSMGVTNHYDALIKVEGNVDADVMSRMEDLGKMLLNDRNFKAGTVNLITKEFTREYRKTGH